MFRHHLNLLSSAVMCLFSLICMLSFGSRAIACCLLAKPSQRILFHSCLVIWTNIFPWLRKSIVKWIIKEKVALPSASHLLIVFEVFIFSVPYWLVHVINFWLLHAFCQLHFLDNEIVFLILKKLEYLLNICCISKWFFWRVSNKQQM